MYYKACTAIRPCRRSAKFMNREKPFLKSFLSVKANNSELKPFRGRPFSLLVFFFEQSLQNLKKKNSSKKF